MGDYKNIRIIFNKSVKTHGLIKIANPQTFTNTCFCYQLFGYIDADEPRVILSTDDLKYFKLFLN